ncbi:hypothetical protein IE53DRAFT_365947 [Violaceomyces palustris]|uniref:Uncharacterized protein n=1 Tax=Violaceomyces palustris TaxID=1673888 RepID=A0ACD0P775_9BASI|nr:hypothetical protein IE53DRAFT_365947 [Violaceomyces palustris]
MNLQPPPRVVTNSTSSSSTFIPVPISVVDCSWKEEDLDPFVLNEWKIHKRRPACPGTLNLILPHILQSQDLWQACPRTCLISETSTKAETPSMDPNSAACISSPSTDEARKLGGAEFLGSRTSPKVDGDRCGNHLNLPSLHEPIKKLNKSSRVLRIGGIDHDVKGESKHGQSLGTLGSDLSDRLFPYQNDQDEESEEAYNHSLHSVSSASSSLPSSFGSDSSLELDLRSRPWPEEFSPQATDVGSCFPCPFRLTSGIKCQHGADDEVGNLSGHPHTESKITGGGEKSPRLDRNHACDELQTSPFCELPSDPECLVEALPNHERHEQDAVQEDFFAVLQFKRCDLGCSPPEISKTVTPRPQRRQRDDPGEVQTRALEVIQPIQYPTEGEQGEMLDTRGHIAIRDPAFCSEDHISRADEAFRDGGCDLKPVSQRISKREASNPLSRTRSFSSPLKLDPSTSQGLAAFPQTACSTFAKAPQKNDASGSRSTIQTRPHSSSLSLGSAHTSSLSEHRNRNCDSVDSVALELSAPDRDGCFMRALDLDLEEPDGDLCLDDGALKDQTRERSQQVADDGDDDHETEKSDGGGGGSIQDPRTSHDAHDGDHKDTFELSAEMPEGWVPVWLHPIPESHVRTTSPAGEGGEISDSNVSYSLIPGRRSFRVGEPQDGAREASIDLDRTQSQIKPLLIYYDS